MTSAHLLISVLSVGAFIAPFEYFYDLHIDLLVRFMLFNFVDVIYVPLFAQQRTITTNNLHHYTLHTTPPRITTASEAQCEGGVALPTDGGVRLQERPPQPRAGHGSETVHQDQGECVL